MINDYVNKFWIFKKIQNFCFLIRNLDILSIYHGGYFILIRKLLGVLFFSGYRGLVSHVKYYLTNIDKSQSNRLKSVATDRKGYVIIVPSYKQNSAGIRVLYKLCEDLNNEGIPTYITGSIYTTNEQLAPIIGVQLAKKLVRNGFIAVYPETIYKNPLGANRVARFVGNIPGLLGGEQVYHESESIFYYSDAYIKFIKNKISGKLFIPSIDESIFFNEEKLTIRNINCFYVGKSSFKEGFFDKRDVIEITRDWPARSDLGKILRKVDILYCFDNSTILAYEAALCGCRVVIIPDGTTSLDAYESYELGRKGIAWGIDELHETINKSIEVKVNYEKVKADYKIQLRNFIDITQAS